jgi:hypothetical protein
VMMPENSWIGMQRPQVSTANRFLVHRNLLVT